MALGTFSKFYYGYQIDQTNNKIDIDEGSGELTATLTSGIYTPTDLAVEIKTQLDAVGVKTYTVTFSRTTRYFTIAADAGTYEILISTGTNALTAPYDLLGFTGAADLTGVITYTSDSPSGSEYKPQFWLQDYVAPENWLDKAESSVNETSTGRVEIISFGDISYTEFNILFITDLPMDNRVIKSNPNGVANARSFLEFLIKRGPVEFMPDVATVATFYTITLETTEESGKGTAFKLKEEVGKSLPNIYTSGKLKFRVT